MKHALTAMLLIAAVIVGCRSVTPPRAAGRRHRPPPDLFRNAHHDQLQNSTALKPNASAATSSVCSPSPSDPLDRRRPLYLEYNYEFFDASGKKRRRPPRWRR
jgi:hypothetical protein